LLITKSSNGRPSNVTENNVTTIANPDPIEEAHRVDRQLSAGTSATLDPSPSGVYQVIFLGTSTNSRPEERLAFFPGPAPWQAQRRD
jgi:hypothetical protein